METPGFLVVTRIPDVIIPECVSGAGVLKCAGGVSVMACMSACEEMVRGPTQTVDGFILEIAPVPQNVASKVRSSFSERPGRMRLKKLAHERPAFWKRPSRGRLKWRELCEFGTDGSTCERVCEVPRAAQRKRRARDAWSKLRERHGKTRRVSVRVMSSAQTSWRELQVSSARQLAWRMP